MEKDTLTIYPQGDLDLVSAKKVKEQVYSLLCARNGLKMLVMNLGEVRFIDSSGLGTTAIFCIYRQLLPAAKSSSRSP